MNNLLPDRKCEVCGVVIEKPPYPMSLKQWNARRFCGRKCFGKAQRIKQRKLPDRTCLACGTSFRPSSFAAKYCSRECAKDRFTHKHGDKNPMWKGGRTTSGLDGYVRVYVPRDHPLIAELEPYLTENRYMLEHRLVMAEQLGRALLPTETVHHVNGDKGDNRPENLQLRQGRHGKGVQWTCSDCGSHNVEPAAI